MKDTGTKHGWKILGSMPLGSSWRIVCTRLHPGNRSAIHQFETGGVYRRRCSRHHARRGIRNGEVVTEDSLRGYLRTKADRLARATG